MEARYRTLRSTAKIETAHIVLQDLLRDRKDPPVFLVFKGFFWDKLAEAVGFEPTVRFPAR
jgi:hypothetical protein